MATCADVITRAMRMTAELGPRETAEGPELDDALPSLQSWYEAAAQDGLFGTLTDVLIDADYVAGEWQRVTSTLDVNVTLPDTIPLWISTECQPQDTDPNAPSRPIHDGAIVILALGSPHQVYRYDAQLKSWISLTDLALTDQAPLSSYDVDGLAACLALRRAGVPGRVVTPAAMAMAKAFTDALSRNSVRAKVDQPVVTDLWRMTRRPFGLWC